MSATTAHTSTAARLPFAHTSTRAPRKRVALLTCASALTTRQLLSVLEEKFDAECHAFLHTSPSGLRGQQTSSPTRAAPVISVPVTSTLAVPLDAFGPGFLAHMTALLGPFPAGLAQLLRGKAPALRALPGLPYIQLGAFLLWVTRSSNEQASPILQAWQQYATHVLPALHDHTCLLTFPSGEAQQLQDAELVHEARQQRQWAREVHAAVTAPLGLAHSLEDTVWALAQVRSRSFEFPLRPGRQLFLIAPFLDLANHVSAPQAIPLVSSNTQSQGAACLSWQPDSTGNLPNCEVLLDEGLGRILLQPTRPLAAGEDVLISYTGEGSCTNLDLLINYGFIEQGNPHDIIQLLPSEPSRLPMLDMSALQAAAEAIIADFASKPQHSAPQQEQLHMQQQQQQQQHTEEKHHQHQHQHQQQHTEAGASRVPNHALGRVHSALASLQAACAVQQERGVSADPGSWVRAAAAWRQHVWGLLSDERGLGATTTRHDVALLIQLSRSARLLASRENEGNEKGDADANATQQRANMPCGGDHESGRGLKGGVASSKVHTQGEHAAAHTGRAQQHGADRGKRRAGGVEEARKRGSVNRLRVAVAARMERKAVLKAVLDVLERSCRQ